MNKYNNSKIYKIVDDGNGNVYYGSTIEKYISRRLQKHISDYKCYPNNKKYFTSYEILKNNNYHIELAENVNCDNRFQLKNRERYYIENYNCVNKNIPNRTNKEYKLKNKDKIKDKNKEYYKDNKDIINDKVKEYYKDNKDIIKDKKKEYYKDNKDKIKEKRKKRYLLNKQIKEFYNIDISIFL